MKSLLLFRGSGSYCCSRAPHDREDNLTYLLTYLLTSTNTRKEPTSAAGCSAHVTDTNHGVSSPVPSGSLLKLASLRGKDAGLVTLGGRGKRDGARARIGHFEAPRWRGGHARCGGKCKSQVDEL